MTAMLHHPEEKKERKKNYKKQKCGVFSKF